MDWTTQPPQQISGLVELDWLQSQCQLFLDSEQQPEVKASFLDFGADLVRVIAYFGMVSKSSSMMRV